MIRAKIYLFIFILLNALFIKANDTLTIAQVYNFSVGDTFDYRSYQNNNDILIFGYAYERFVVMQKTYNSGNDTLHYYLGPPGGNITDSLMVTNLDSIADFEVARYLGGCTAETYDFADTSSYPGFESNSFAASCVSYTDTFRFTAGLGETYSSQYIETTSGDGLNIFRRKLIYYASSTISIGTPYYVVDWSTTIKYIPLPEVCASWTRTIDDTGIVGPSGYTAIVEEIRTGDTFPKNGHTYVPMICRIENYTINRFTPDSLIGYFYNDSATQTAYWVTDTVSAAPQVLCPFNTLFGTQCSSVGYYTLDSVYIGNEYRTRWTCSPLGPGDPNENIISGIGYLTGLLEVSRYYAGPYPVDGQLSCFSVCGQTIYPSPSTGDCALISSIESAGASAFDLNIYPTVTSGNMHVQSDIFTNMHYSIYDVSGQLITGGNFTDNMDQINVSALMDGLYLIQFTDGKSCANRRFVVMH